MHIAASSPLAIDKEGLDQNVLKKEKEIITEELKNSGKDNKILDKIADLTYVHFNISKDGCKLDYGCSHVELNV